MSHLFESQHRRSFTLLTITNTGGASVRASLYAYDAAGQLTNEVCLTNGFTGGATNGWVYDEAGNWLNPSPTSQWVYNTDNELSVKASQGDTSWGVTVTGTVDGGPANNKWYRTTAECRGVSAPVSQADGTFTLPNVPLSLGANALVVTVTDVSGNHSQQTRNVTKTNNALENFAYDNNGNLTNWINGTTNWVYQWDWADRLTKATSNSIVVLENWYDASSRRIAKKEVVNGQTQSALYLSDGRNIVAVMNESGQLRETFTRGVGLAGDVGTLVAVTHHTGSAVTPGTYYAHHNHRGDVVRTRSGTSTTGTYDYSPFGLLKSQTGTDVCRFKFSTKERDAATGFSYYGYRFYAPQWQRWLNHDPIGERGGLNLYSFVGNNPWDFVDPFGLSASDYDNESLIDIGRGIYSFNWGVCRSIRWMWNSRVLKLPNMRDKREHCITSCQMTKINGGTGIPKLCGDIREWVDPGPDSAQDQAANRAGRDCATDKFCGKKQPSCEECCRAKGYY